MARSAFVLLACCAAFAACAGGGTTPVSRPSGSPSSAAPAPVSTTVAVTQAGGLTSPVVLPSVDGYQSTLQFGANSAPTGTSLAIGVSRTLPAGLVPLSSDRHPGAARRIAGIRRPLRAPPADSNPLLYFTITSSQGFTLDGAPGFTITTPSVVEPTGSLVLVAFDDPKYGWIEIGGFTVTGTTLTYSGTPPGTFPLTFQANVTYGIAVYSSASPPPFPSAAPTLLQFVSSSNSQVITVTEAGYQGSFVATSSNTDVAVVTRGTGPGTFGVIPGLPGNATIYITDSYDATVEVEVAVDNLPSVPDTPEPTPTIITIAPHSLDLYYPPTNDPAFPVSGTVIVSESGYSGSFQATGYPGLPCTPYATIAGSGSKSIPATFTITATGLGPGGSSVTCDILFTDANDISDYMTVRIHPPLHAVIH
jgi:hypothetical protein